MPTTASLKKRPLRLVLCEPRGFCAGVERAIDSVHKALALYGAPVYVRHEIVHNQTVVSALEAEGAIFIEDLDEINDPSRPVIFSAHGVPKSVPDQARALNLIAIDATCPLVTKVHREAMSHNKRNRHVILIGHQGHPEVIGTLGQLPEGTISLIETLEQAESFIPPQRAQALAYVTQTTLSVHDTREIINILIARFPDIYQPAVDDICYATTNRQNAVIEVTKDVDAFIVVGAENSSNSRRLIECAERAGCHPTALVRDVQALDWDQFRDVRSLGLSAGASAPEHLIQAIVTAFQDRFDVTLSLHKSAEESMFFPLPRPLRTTDPEHDEA